VITKCCVGATALACPPPCSGKSCEGFDQHRNAEQDQNHAEPSDKLEIEERRLQTPLRNPPRHDTGDRLGAIRKKTADPRTAKPLVMMLSGLTNPRVHPRIATRSRSPASS